MERAGGWNLQSERTVPKGGSVRELRSTPTLLANCSKGLAPTRQHCSLIQMILRCWGEPKEAYLS